MNRLLASVGLGLLLTTGGITTAAQADHNIPGPPVVEGNASARLLQRHADGSPQYAYVCQAVTSGGLVASTGVNCRVIQNDVVVQEFGYASEGNAVVAPPQRVNLADGPFQICWTARALTFHVDFIYDEVEPNCADF